MEDISHLKKINTKGEYCRFPGVTVVAAAGNNNNDLWSAIFRRVKESSLLANFYGILPLESYHMTTINLAVQVENPQWQDFIDKRLLWFHSLSEEIELHSFEPRIISIEPEFLGSIVLLKLQLPKEQIEINERIAAKFSISHLIPPYYHITIGYQYRSFDEGTAMSLQREFLSLVSDCLKEYQRPIILDAPHLTFFNDMTAFIPWNATENPFKSV